MIVFLRRNEGLLVVIAPLIVVLGTIALVLFSNQERSIDFSHSVLNAFVSNEHWLRSGLFNWTLTPIIASGLMVMLNRLIAEQGLLERLSNFPLLFFSLLFLLVPLPLQNVLFWLSSLLSVYALSCMIDIIHEKNVDFATFNGALSVGLASLLNNGFVVMIGALFLALIIANRQTVRRLFLMTLGYFIPLYLLLGILYIFSPTEISVLLGEIVFTPGLATLRIPQLLLLVLILSNVSILVFRVKSITMKQKRLLRFTTLFLLISCCTLLILPAFYFEGLILVPLTIVLSNTLTRVKNNVSARIQLFAIILVVAINLIN